MKINITPDQQSNENPVSETSTLLPAVIQPPVIYAHKVPRRTEPAQLTSDDQRAILRWNALTKSIMSGTFR